MENTSHSTNYIRFGVLVAIVILINLVFYYRTKLYPNTTYYADLNKNVNSKDLKNIRISFATRNIDQNSSKLTTKPSVFCIVKTHPDNIANNKTLTVLNVWGRKCDNYR